jgi:glycosyltransferase involved in cell wall biosynthesis
MPNCIDLPALSSQEVIKTKTILIAGMKNPGFAIEIAKRLREDGHKIELLLSLIPRHEFLDHLKVAQLVILLPMEREGFFLPALEAMAMGCLVVCPDCIGNRSFCHDGINSFRPQYQLDAIVQSAKNAIKLDKEKIQQITSNAGQTVENHALAKERHKFHDILSNLNEYT